MTDATGRYIGLTRALPEGLVEQIADQATRLTDTDREWFRKLRDQLLAEGTLTDQQRAAKAALDTVLEERQVVELARAVPGGRTLLRAFVAQLAAAGWRPGADPDDALMLKELRAEHREYEARIDEALCWIDDPKDATPEILLAKIRAALQGKEAPDAYEPLNTRVPGGAA